MTGIAPDDLRYCHRAIEAAARELLESPHARGNGFHIRCVHGEDRLLSKSFRVWADWPDCLPCAISFVTEYVHHPMAIIESGKYGFIPGWQLMGVIAEHWADHPAGVFMAQLAEMAEMKSLTTLKNP